MKLFLGIDIGSVSINTVVMNEVREDLNIGRVNESPEVAKGIDAKFLISDLLGLKINCVEMFKKRVGI